MALWQKINLHDLDHLNKHSRLYPPYCHVNVVDLWAYKVTDNFWFEVGDTIAYKLNHYNDDSLYITLLGNKNARQAIQMIAKNSPGQSQLVFDCVPETTLKNLNNWEAIVSTREDIDNHDYIFDLASLITFESEALRKQAKKFRKLIRQHPGLHYELLDPASASDRDKIYSIFKRWVGQTGALDWHKEYRALERALNLTDVGLVCLGFYDGPKLIGYTINRPEHQGYYQAYFGKADRGYNPLSLFQEHATATYMQENFGCQYMNLQPDSGITGLRNYKTALGPSHHLKKFSVTIDVAKCLVDS